MAVLPNSRPDPDEARSGHDAAGSGRAEKRLKTTPHSEIEEVAEIVAKAGGGSLSFDLALDLVLNEMVQEACQQTRATGAVIALEQDGAMICRAAAGNAPELGMRVAASNLSAACLTQKEVQLCSETQTDARVDSEACRRLGVRSMLIAPLADMYRTFGLVEVFSSSPNAFSEDDINTMHELSEKISNSIKVTAQRVQSPGIAAEDSDGLFEQLKSPPTPVPVEAEAEAGVPESQKRDVLTSVLVVLVIASAMLLGVLIGVKLTLKGAKAGNSVPSIVPQSHEAGAVQSTAGADDGTLTSGLAAHPQPATSARAIAAPPGGLVVMENGKVIFRTSPGNSTTNRSAAAQESSSVLLRRVDPQYPEAAKNQGIQGPVVLEAQVLGDGTVGNIAVVKGDPTLAEAARQAVKQWKYKAYVVDGRRVSRQERIIVNFRLPSS